MPTGLNAALERLNALRRQGAASKARTAMEETLDLLFETRQRLVVYGSLAPGEANHGQLRSLEGRWIEGSVRGEYHDGGWGARMGYPAMRWNPTSSRAIDVKLFVSRDLTSHWDRLDTFEGDGYQCVLVPVHQGSRLIAVANVYELAGALV